MRDDMFKVIVERPRRGVGYYRTLPNEYRAAKHFKLDYDFNVDDEYCSAKMPMRHRNLGWDGKELNENLNPLRRFVAKQVGRLWDDVYSEISAKLDASSTVKQHVRDHLKDFVNFKTYCTEDGQRWAAGRYGPTPIYYRDFFVDEKGILCGSPEKTRYKGKTFKEIRAANERVHKREINGVIYEKDDKGIWFRVDRTERTYMRTYFQGGGVAPIKRLYTEVTFRKWTVGKNDLRDLKLYE